MFGLSLVIAAITPVILDTCIRYDGNSFYCCFTKDSFKFRLKIVIYTVSQKNRTPVTFWHIFTNTVFVFVIFCTKNMHLIKN